MGAGHMDGGPAQKSSADPRRSKRGRLPGPQMSKSPSLDRLFADGVLEKSIQHAVDREANLMTTDLWYLACTAMLTAALWIPYIICQVRTNGFLVPENYVDPTPRPVPLWGHRAHRAYLNAV